MNLEIVLSELIPNTVSASKSGEITDVGDKIAQMMPSLPMMFATLGALLVLMLILTFFLYKPISKMVKKRQNFIQKNIDNSIKAKEEAAKLSSDSFKELTESRLIANEIINRAKKESEVTKQHYINNGKIEAQKLLEEANRDIKNLKEDFEQSKKESIIDIAIQISEKILLEKVDPKDIEKYYKEIESQKNA
ncbi:MAG: F0F1 ATP synthase subunit B [Metamycoplasmataceae bacterium]